MYKDEKKDKSRLSMPPEYSALDANRFYQISFWGLDSLKIYHEVVFLGKQFQDFHNCYDTGLLCLF